MPNELIDKIVDNLGEWDYSNRVSFYNNNEPFLDKRIFDIIKSTREKLPKAYLELKSNGTVINTEKILRIFNAGLDMLYINDYSKNGQFNKNVLKIIRDGKQLRRFMGHFENGQYFRRIIIQLRDVNAIAGTRAGSSPNNPYMGRPLQKTCFRPFEMMTINPEGNVSICSEDINQSITMGNIKQQTLFEIWTSQDWNALRGKLILGDRSCTIACSKCYYKGFTYEMLKENGLYKKRTFFNKFKARFL